MVILDESHEQVALLLVEMGSGTTSPRPSSPEELFVQNRLVRIAQILDFADRIERPRVPEMQRTWRKNAFAETRGMLKKKAYVKSLKLPFMCATSRTLTVPLKTTLHVDTVANERSKRIALDMMALTHHVHASSCNMSQNSSVNSLTTVDTLAL